MKRWCFLSLPSLRCNLCCCGIECCPVYNGKHEIVIKTRRIGRDEYVNDPPEICVCVNHSAKDRCEVIALTP